MRLAMQRGLQRGMRPRRIWNGNEIDGLETGWWTGDMDSEDEGDGAPGDELVDRASASQRRCSGFR